MEVVGRRSQILINGLNSFKLSILVKGCFESAPPMSLFGRYPDWFWNFARGESLDEDLCLSFHGRELVFV